jgi:hypothetical protein
MIILIRVCGKNLYWSNCFFLLYLLEQNKYFLVVDTGANVDVGADFRK